MTEETMGSASDEKLSERQRQLIEAGRQHELLETIRYAVRSEIQNQFKLFYGTASPEQIHDQHHRVKHFFRRWDVWMERFWYGLVAKGLRWLVVVVIALNLLSGNQLLYPFLDKFTK